MREYTKGVNTFIEFNSIQEFVEYLKKDVTDNFKNVLSSENLLKNGWTQMTERLKTQLKAQTKMAPTMTSKNVLSVQGYQPVVPNYLMGLPNSMITKKVVPVKQKVVTLSKCVAYSWKVSTDTIVKESVKALRLIQKLEASGYRINLNVLLFVRARNGQGFCVKVRIKNSGEKLNISKLSFPLVHPSFLRRLYFRFVEVHPTIPECMNVGYGTPLSPTEISSIMNDSTDILLPQFIKKDIECKLIDRPQRYVISTTNLKTIIFQKNVKKIRKGIDKRCGWVIY